MPLLTAHHVVGMRFVVLQHTGWGVDHFDLMLQCADAPGRLMTFRSPVWPIDLPVALEPIGDHRLDYLDYEGPISGGRGNVRRVASGRVEAIHGTENSRHFELHGDDGGRFSLYRDNRGTWTARREI